LDRCRRYRDRAGTVRAGGWSTFGSGLRREYPGTEGTGQLDLNHHVPLAKWMSQ
jgi:hypothetical protein